MVCRTTTNQSAKGIKLNSNIIGPDKKKKNGIDYNTTLKSYMHNSFIRKKTNVNVHGNYSSHKT